MVTVKQTILDDVRCVTDGVLQTNVIPMKRLKNYIGRVMHGVFLIFILQLSVIDLYGALHNGEVRRATSATGGAGSKQS